MQMQKHFQTFYKNVIKFKQNIFQALYNIYIKENLVYEH